jgi:hypothetical protein
MVRREEIERREHRCCREAVGESWVSDEVLATYLQYSCEQTVRARCHTGRVVNPVGIR